jgi:hypothetical protein
VYVHYYQFGGFSLIQLKKEIPDKCLFMRYTVLSRCLIQGIALYSISGEERTQSHGAFQLILNCVAIQSELSSADKHGMSKTIHAGMNSNSKAIL